MKKPCSTPRCRRPRRKGGRLCLRCHARAERERKRRIAAELKELRRAKYFNTVTSDVDKFSVKRKLRRKVASL